MRMRHHDWYFYMSDDPKVFRRGERARARLMSDLRRVKPSEAQELWETYAPKLLPNPFKLAG